MKEYIEREKARTLITNYGKGSINDNRKALDPVDDIIMLAKGVDLIPAADVVEVVHGEWEYYNGSGYVKPHFRCTNCGQPRYEHYACNDFKYCPNCGAKMDGGADNG